MSVTARDIIQGAFEQVRVYAPGETALNADVARAFDVLNSMLDSWSNESLSCYAILEQTGNLHVGITQYTIGIGGTFNMTRPLRLIDGPGAAYILDTNNDKYPIDVVPRDEWNMISQPNVNADLPTTLFYDPQFPLGVINIWPAPNIAYPLFFDSYLQLSEFTSLVSPISFPPGYKKAIQDNLALELSDYFPNAKITQRLIQAAGISKGNIKRTNIRPVRAEYDPELVSKATGTYNIYNDSAGGGTRGG
jgi:hypothetical protein